MAETNGTHDAQANGVPPTESNSYDASILDTDPDVSAAGQEATQAESMARSTSNSKTQEETQTNGELRQEAMDFAQLQEERAPLRKDISMREFLGKMDDYAPVVSPALKLLRAHADRYRYPTLSPFMLSHSPA